MNGKIEAKSSYGEGTTVYFSIEVGVSSDESFAMQAIANSLVSSPTAGRQQLQGNVLLVEDNAVNQEIAVELLAQSLKPGGIMLIGEPYWRQLPATDEIAQACGVSSTSDFLTLPGLVGAFDDLGYDVVEMVLADQEGWDRYEAAKWLTMRRWLEANPDDDFAAEVRAELNIAPKRYVTYARECFGWGVFALIAR